METQTDATFLRANVFVTCVFLCHYSPPFSSPMKHELILVCEAPFSTGEEESSLKWPTKGSNTPRCHRDSPFEPFERLSLPPGWQGQRVPFCDLSLQIGVTRKGQVMPPTSTVLPHVRGTPQAFTPNDPVMALSWSGSVASKMVLRPSRSSQDACSKS